MRLNGKVALITGAAGGIGGVVTRMYLREGARVAISSRSLERAEQFRAALMAEGFSGDDILPVAFAPTDLAGMQAALEAIAARWGGLDVLINNAGSAGAKQPLFRIPFTLEDLDQLAAEGFTETETMRESAANLLGLPWHLTRLALPYLRVGASIINVSTIFFPDELLRADSLRRAQVGPECAVAGAGQTAWDDRPRRARQYRLSGAD